ncbi:MAG TPA: tetratricopeptide repeat protein [Gemmatimonadaceae bacterium]|nr:tetratricopeptide repeat protein [Gemmatimonadaceae bacterium]
MANIAKLKKKAADYELKKQPDKAIAAYIELLRAYEDNPEEMDVALYNRVGDLLLKQGNVGDAVDYYERAVDHYAESGFHNNAIALCNKILRQSPGRTSIYYKLGKISAQKGFAADAKRNFLEFADRMQKAGKMDEAFNALKEFADLCPDQDDIRLMLADQLQKAGKPAEAVAQLQMLYQRYTADGRKAEAEATAKRIRSIDPSAEVSAGDTPLESKAQDLVFLDLNEEPTPPRASSARAAAQPEPVPAPEPEPASEPEPEPESEPEAAPEPIIERTSLGDDVSADTLEAEQLDGVTRTDMSEGVETSPDGASLLDGLQSTSFDQRATGAIPSSLLDLEPTAMAEPQEAPPASEPEDSATTDDDSIGGDLDLIMPDESRESATPPTPPAPPALGVSLVGIELEESAAATASTESDAPAAPEAETAAEATPAEPVSGAGRSSTLVAAQSMEMLQAVVDGDPNDWNAHRELGEAMLEAGNREGGLHEFEAAMKGYEADGDLEAAASMADEIVRADPSSVKYQQKRVEYAYRANDKGRLVGAYLDLADALFRSEQVDKARSIYHRVLELVPDNARALGAISSLPDEPVEPPPEPKAPRASRVAGAPRVSTHATPAAPIELDGDFVNLGDLMRDDEPEKDTRMVVEEREPSGDEEADFADMLRKFKQGVAENVEAEDYQSHYDLGIAYKEMGLLDEAISEFQTALRGTENRGRTYEAIGNCFMEKEQYQMANTLLTRALREPGMTDDKLVGVLYLLGRANEALGKGTQALEFYQRVFVIDVQFRDVGDRMNAIEQAAR